MSCRVAWWFQVVKITVGAFQDRAEGHFWLAVSTKTQSFVTHCHSYSGIILEHTQNPKFLLKLLGQGLGVGFEGYICMGLLFFDRTVTSRRALKNSSQNESMVRRLGSKACPKTVLESHRAPSNINQVL